ncbi:Protein of unknown function [Gryllus bimaculatus]|nr:Protein of unknown function [Gryllus bimaculatus]
MKEMSPTKRTSTVTSMSSRRTY